MTAGISHRNTLEENACLESLLNNLDNCIASTSPSKDKRPTNKTRGTKSPQKSPKKTAECDIEWLVQGAESWDWADMEEEVDIDVRTPQLPTNQPERQVALKPWVARCKVISVLEQEHKGKPSKLLTVSPQTSAPGPPFSVVLLDDWQYLDIYTGDILNIIVSDSCAPNTSDTISSSPIEISAHQNIVILHPDTLISATFISQTSYCARRPLISSLLSNSTPDTPSNSAPKSTAWIWGNFVHEVMQLCFRDGIWTKDDIVSKINAVLNSPKGLLELFRAGVTLEEARTECLERAQGLETFGARYIGDRPKPSAVLSDSPSTSTNGTMAVTKLLEIEEEIISPTYGIKGKVDASLEVMISTQAQEQTQHSIPLSIMPFEIKTGRVTGVLEHKAQTTLYTLLMAERYGVDVSGGLLYYTQSENVTLVPSSRNELRGLLTRRNEMAEYMMRRQRPESQNTFLPDCLEDNWACKRCYAVDGCMLYRKEIERVDDVSSDIAELYQRKTGHLSERQCDFFRTWEHLISLEEQDMTRFRKELWTMSSLERQEHGRCFANMVLMDEHSTAADRRIKTDQYVYQFRSSGDGQSTLLNGHLNVGDAITVSVEPNLLMLARGYILELMSSHVTLGIDHGLDYQQMQQRTGGQDPLIFRIDKDELSGGMARIRENIAQLFYNGGDAKRRSLIVDLAPPTFDSIPDDALSTTLNANQQQAVEKILSAKDYALVLGMPGTGKTSTIAETIKILCARGKTVLLASYTHSAVDTILLKLMGADIDILRLGNVNKIHQAVRKYTVEGRGPIASLSDLEKILLSSPVVATTCLSIDHALFSRRRFDYCIIDEASQITLPTCIGPLRFADKFVLVGDHFQLPPLVRSLAARKGGYDVSLFRQLSEAHPEAVVELAFQYRMNEDIMSLSNELIYDNRLRCGSHEVANRALVLPRGNQASTLHDRPCHKNGCWIDRLLQESCKAVFVDTDQVPAKESFAGSLPQNQVEASLVCQFVEMLVQCGVSQHEIGIVSLYRQQLKIIKHLLAGRADIELLTADRSQGRDKECIVVSMVRSNNEQQVGDLLKDWRRINVAFTRARSKLVIFGSRKTLCSVPVLADFLQHMEKRRWVISLPTAADSIHFSSTISTKRPLKIHDEVLQNTITSQSSPIKKTKRAKLEIKSKPMLKNRPILGDILNGRG